MPNWLSITWEEDRLLVLAARTQGKSATFEHLGVLKLNTTENGGVRPGDSSAQLAAVGSGAPRLPQNSLKKQLVEFIKEHKLAKAETIVLLSRSDVEVRPLVFPPVPADELPDLVKFQASKEFNAYDVDSPLDYFITNKLDNVSRSTLFPVVKSAGKADKSTIQKTDASAEKPKHVLASTIRSETFRKIKLFCDELGLTLRRVVLRPCEAAKLFEGSKLFIPGRITLLVELDFDETSQTVLCQGEPIFMRCPKISCPEDISNPDFVARLAAELKRTRIAVRNEIQGVTVDEIVLCGVDEKFESLASQLADDLAVPVRTFDPWGDVSCGGELKKTPVQAKTKHPERFASLLGSIVQASRSVASEIDFCNPKKRIEPIGQRQLLNAVIASVLVLVLALIAFGLYSRNALIKEVRMLSQKKLTLEKTAKTVSTERIQLKAIDDWFVDDVNWFEQLAWLSHQAPEAKDMILTDLIMSANQGGSMAIKSLVRDSTIVSPMEERLRDEKHDVKAGEKGEFKGNPLYGFRYNLSVFLSKTAAAASADTSSSPETPAIEAVQQEPEKLSGTTEKTEPNTTASDESPAGTDPGKPLGNAAEEEQDNKMNGKEDGR